MDTLRTGIIVALRTLRRPLRNQLGGRGVSRKREPMAALMVAEHITRMVARNHRFKNGEGLASAKVLEGYLSSVIQQLPDAVVYLFASKAQIESLPAGEEIADLILSAMQRDWAVSYETPTIVPITAKFGTWKPPAGLG